MKPSEQSFNLVAKSVIYHSKRNSVKPSLQSFKIIMNSIFHKRIIFSILFTFERRGGHLVSALDSGAGAVRVRALAGDIVLCSCSLLSQCLSPPRCINGYRHILGET